MAPRLGIQLYTLRDHVGPAVFRETLRMVADLGFAGVEFAWQYGGMSPEELGDFLLSLDLACCGMHVQLSELLEPDHIVYDYAQRTGAPFITTSLCQQTAEFARLCPQLDEAGRIAADKGLVFTYHNHWQEFEPGPDGLPQDLLLANTLATHVRLELDLGWVRKAGGDALAFWRRERARTPQVHLRDYDTEAGTVCDVGDGFLDPLAVWKQACELGTEWLIYEQDRYPVSPQLSCQTCARRMCSAMAGKPAQ
jgi:sugar phosphate isomerase/epimerase